MDTVVVYVEAFDAYKYNEGVRIFEDVANTKSGKSVLVKAVGVVNANADIVFEVILNVDRHQRYEWDMLTGDLKSIDSLNGHYDVVYGTYDPQHFSRCFADGNLKGILSSPGNGFEDKMELIKVVSRKYPFSFAFYSHHEALDQAQSSLTITSSILSLYSMAGMAMKLCWAGYYEVWWQHYCLAILQFPTVHKKYPPKSGYRRTEINPSTWEIRSLNTSPASNFTRCLVTQILEIHSVGWRRWKNIRWSKLEKTVPYAMLSQVAGLKEYIGGNPSLISESSTTFVHSKISDFSSSNSEYEDSEVADEFYDAIADDSSSDDEDGDNEEEADNKDKKMKLKNISWAIVGLALKRTSAPGLKKELDTTVPPIILDPTNYHGSMCQGKDETDTNCWTSPSGTGFMIRGKTYLKDNSKVMGGDPLLKLIAVDWFKVENCISKVALHPSSLVQSEAGKKLPFILILNLEISGSGGRVWVMLVVVAKWCWWQRDGADGDSGVVVVPARPNYSMVLYYAADRPVNKNSLLGKFVDGSDMFRDSRFKLIPRIVEGYWMVKRAVGTKACILGKAVTCEYLRQDNFLEIDVDIGSSSVARSVITLVLGYVTSIVVDLAILIEAKEEAELPEYILGTVRLNRVKLDSAVPFEV
ncbi:hypothetical protein TEA_012341 [Camellia sinensis var. sinensis]|uniref:Protein ENHANCED DISEASE RESISTANCE 2 C-terminal domain-containing protein n=1 Tax=Camellia sinensis var. sinensis TaxID=542762 RepID=A0A4S4E4Z9_CAMSN|nr:hypothetical protein TEA_012341 [Camellia sinensis var. sinensis]